MLELEEQLPRMRAAWMAGGSALSHAPADWRPLAGEGPGAEAVLAALAGQAMQALFRPTAPPDLSPRVAQLETDLGQAQQDIGEMKQELALLTRRGQPAD